MLTTKETDMLRRSVREVKRKQIEDPEYPHEFPFEPRQTESSTEHISEAVSLVNGTRSFVAAVGGRS